MRKWDLIARTGTHTDMNGKRVKLTREYMDRIVQTYDPKQHEAPLVIGHPKSNDPAYGWVEEVKREGDDLLARYAQVPDELRKAVDNGRYKKKSLSLYTDGTLRHVGLLGAVPPAIKGLGDVQLAEEDAAITINFDFGEPSPEQPDNPGEEEEMDLKEKVKELEDQLAVSTKARKEAEGKAQEAENKAKKAEASFAEAQDAKAKDAREAKADALVKDGKLLPAERDKALAFAERLEGGDELCFAEGEGKKPLADHFWDWLDKRSSHGLFEFSEPGASAPTGGEPVGDLTLYV